MRVGIDFPDHFLEDNFKIRRGNSVGCGVAYDPESLISGQELAQGFTYTNSSRNWLAEFHYLAAVNGELDADTILRTAPRVFKEGRNV